MEKDVFLIYEFIENIKIRLNEIIYNSNEKDTIAKAKDIIAYINDYTEGIKNDRETLAKCIENTMKQPKYKHSELEGILYIIHGDLINSRISVEKARELYEQYLSIELFEKKGH